MFKAAPRAPSVRMTADERRATAGLASIFGLRMLGMFIILPVFALYADALPGGRNKTLVGIALGAYGLTQAILQIPFGWVSDRWGRKPVIYSGLVIFALGSFVAAAAGDIYWIIAGRTLQGAGAISAAVLALAADTTRDVVRTRTMAVIGMTIFATFALSLVAGPALSAAIGVPGIFALTGVLALAATLIVRAVIPAGHEKVPPPVENAFARVLSDRQLLRLNYGIFALHALLMSLFIEIPFALRDNGIAEASHWKVYLPVLVASVALMWPFVRQSDRPGRGKPIFLGAVALLLIAQVVLGMSQHTIAGLVAGLILFFTAFNLLEATLPALVSRYAPRDMKGTAVGIYSSVQFLGTFAGAAAGGWLAQHEGGIAVFAFGVVLTMIWLGVGATMAAPPDYSTQLSMGRT
ncbi:MAG TPA: MFS transporter [Casimicrobiaceae bacterium]|nr:MFS transporter [Casimicrobiaceae bacterium]